MVEQDLCYIKEFVVDYFVFEWSMNVITWYVYNVFLYRSLPHRGNSI